jgi:hypothetical protein
MTANFNQFSVTEAIRVSVGLSQRLLDLPRQSIKQTCMDIENGRGRLNRATFLTGRTAASVPPEEVVLVSAVLPRKNRAGGASFNSASGTL